MINLKQIYSERRDVRDSDIPEAWKESFYNFMFGQTCRAEVDEDGNVKEFIYYSHDFRIWYDMNKESIERDNKLKELGI